MSRLAGSARRPSAAFMTTAARSRSRRAERPPRVVLISNIKKRTQKRTRNEGEAMTNAAIRDCIAPDRNPRKPKIVLPKGSIDTHVHVFEMKRYKMNPDRGY